ncbi:MAG TPA: hypothetical protein PK071_04520, partial [Atopobiaceae bacterium]|nr:hypothetical protein [Atopobiaceae bacterium]
RDESKIEIDLVDDTGSSGSELVEIKSQMGFRESFLRHLPAVGDDLGIPVERRCVVTRGDESFGIRGMRVWSARDWLMRE